jgi:protein SCO1
MCSAYLTRNLMVLVALASLLVLSGCALPFGSSQRADAGAGERADPSGSAPWGVVLDEPQPAPDFTLIDHDGEPFRRSSLDGRVVAVFFGYTGCPDVCPLTLSFMAQATAELGDQRDGVAFLFVTVDPERDTPERLASYIERIDAPIVALTGEQAALEQVWRDYDIMVERHERADGAYLVDHSAQVWLIDRHGMVQGFLPMGAGADDLTNDLRWLLREGA